MLQRTSAPCEGLAYALLMKPWAWKGMHSIRGLLYFMCGIDFADVVGQLLCKLQGDALNIDDLEWWLPSCYDMCVSLCVCVCHCVHTCTWLCTLDLQAKPGGGTPLWQVFSPFLDGPSIMGWCGAVIFLGTRLTSTFLLEVLGTVHSTDLFPFIQEIWYSRWLCIYLFYLSLRWVFCQIVAVSPEENDA